MRIVLCGGGTGGHVYPLLVAREALLESARPDEKIEFIFIGGEGIEQELVAREGVPFQAIKGGGLHGVGILRAIPNLYRLSAGAGQAWRILRRHQPDAILFTGGFIAIPVAVAAWLLRIPMVVYLPDIEPALSVRVLGWFAQSVAATTEASRAHFAARKFVVTGYPVRRALCALAAGMQRAAQARATFGIGSQTRVLLIFGGSRGARNLNRAVIAHAEALLAQAELIHVSGAGEWDEVRTARAQLPAALQQRYHAFPYLHDEMGAAYASADLIVSRSGASSLGEFPLFGLPSVLVPYPYAWRYQKVNADFLVQRGAALLVRDEELMAQLLPTVQRLLADPLKLQTMREQAQKLAQPNAAARLADEVKKVVAQKRKG